MLMSASSVIKISARFLNPYQQGARPAVHHQTGRYRYRKVSELSCIHSNSSGESLVCQACLACTIFRCMMSRAVTEVSQGLSAALSCFLDELIQQQFFENECESMKSVYSTASKKGKTPNYGKSDQ